jgi:anti-sigma regulatory factor (Ser/Thr protein kinase)
MTKYTKHLETDIKKKRKDIAKAQMLQRKLNSQTVPNIANLNILSFFMPCEELGGDFLEIKKIGDKLAIILSDCTGHGIQAAMDATLLKSITDRHIHHMAINNGTDKFLELVNKDIIEYLHEDQFPTMFACVIDIKTNNVYYSNANSELPYLINNKSKNQTLSIKLLPKTKGFHIGYDKNITFGKKSFKLKKNDILLFYSDALVEIGKKKNKTKGQKKLLPILKKMGNGLTKDLDYLLTKAQKENGILPLDDDLTLIMIERIQTFKKKYTIHRESQIPRIQNELVNAMAYYNYNEDDIECTNISFSELAINAITHGNNNNFKKKVSISITIDCEQTVISVEDQGKGFNIANISDPTNLKRLKLFLENNDVEKYTHGRGIFLVKQYMDSLSYTHKGKKATTIKKRQNFETIFKYEEHTFSVNED